MNLTSPSALLGPGFCRIVSEPERSWLSISSLTTPSDRSPDPRARWGWRSEEHTSELQSHLNLVCRLLLDKKNTVLEKIAVNLTFCGICVQLNVHSRQFSARAKEAAESTYTPRGWRQFAHDPVLTESPHLV